MAVAEAKFPAPGAEQPDERVRNQLQALADAVRRREAILFIGGGISQNLGLPDFGELIRHLAEQLQLDLKDLSLDDYPVLAEAYLKSSGDFDDLREWMNGVWHPPAVDVARSEVHNLLLELDFPTIYTTNYDHWLEAAYEARNKPFRKIVSITDLSHPRDNRTEIIKFHGDFDAEEELVLTETSYFQRMAFEAPLDIRLRADSLARPLLFVGYSLRDVNIRYLLFRLEEIWKSSPHGKQRPCSYVLMTESQPAQEIVLRSRNVQPLVFADENPGRATQLFLTTLLQLVRGEGAAQKIATINKANGRIRYTSYLGGGGGAMKARQQQSPYRALADPIQLPSFEDQEEFETGANNVVRVIIETAKGSRNKFSYDEKLHVFRLKRVLPEGMSFPCDFGFIPSTLGGDGDPLDALVLMDEAGCTGALVDCRVIGAICGEQSSKHKPKRVRNDRIVAVAIPSHTHSDLQEIGQLNATQLRELEAFFVNYHQLYGEKFKVLGHCGAREARKMVKKGIKERQAA